ncbi:F-box domain containing protein [Tanacetum coccineum]
MDRLPSSIICDILSRVPRKCLARSRCVSKAWGNYVNDPYLMIVHDERVIEEPTPILYHSHLSYDKRTVRSLCFHVIESKHTGTPDRTYVLWPKEGPFLEFLRKKHLSESSYVQFRVHSSCNGLICLSEDKDYVITSLVVVHPLRKECYKRVLEKDGDMINHETTPKVKLFSIRGIGSNSFPMKKTDFKESCQRLLARYYYNSDPDSVLSRIVRMFCIGHLELVFHGWKCSHPSEVSPWRPSSCSVIVGLGIVSSSNAYCVLQVLKLLKAVSGGETCGWCAS